MNFSLPKLFVFGFFLSFTLMGAEVFEDDEANAIFSAFKVSGSAAACSCAQLSEDVYITFSHMVDNEQLWADFNQRKEHLEQRTIQSQITEQHDSQPQSCLILTFNKEKTIILERNGNRYKGKKVLGIHIISKISASNAEKYAILAFTESAEKLSLTLPKFKQISHNFDFSAVVDWKISFALPLIQQTIYPLPNTFMYSNSASRSLFMHRTPILEKMIGGLIWDQDNQLVGMLVAHLPSLKESHSFDEQNTSILQQVSTRFKFGFTPSKEHADYFDLELKELAVGQLINQQEIEQAYFEYRAALNNP